MKKIVLGILIAGSVIQVKAQTFKKFKFDISTGYAISTAKKVAGSKSGGIVLAFEPKYALNDKFTAGLRMEGAATSSASVDGSSGSMKMNGSYLLTGDYYTNTNKFRPFAGLGLGIFSVAGLGASDTDLTISATENKFGFAPRIGFEYGHFRTAIEYNSIGKSDGYSYSDGTTTKTTDKTSNGYIGVKFGFFLGGGRK